MNSQPQASRSTSTPGSLAGVNMPFLLPEASAEMAQVRNETASLKAPAAMRGSLPAAMTAYSLMTAKHEALDYVLPGFARGTVGGFTSPGGTGKSYWALQLAVAMGSTPQADLVGLAPKAGGVLVLSAEDLPQVVAERLRAITALTPEGTDLSPSFDFRPCLGLDLNIMKDAVFADILRAATGKRLVILDTLSRFHELDENSSRDMKVLMGQLERLAMQSGAAVLFIHHNSKGAALNGQGGLQQSARGSSVIVDHARWVCFLEPMSDVQARTLGIPSEHRASYVRWNISKQNYGARIDDVWYFRTADGVLLPHTGWAHRASPLQPLTLTPAPGTGSTLHLVGRRTKKHLKHHASEEMQSKLVEAAVIAPVSQKPGEATRVALDTVEKKLVTSLREGGSGGSARNAYGNNW